MSMYAEGSLKITLDVKSWNDKKLTKRQKIKFIEEKKEEILKMIKNIEDTKRLLDDNWHNLDNFQDILKTELKTARKHRDFLRALREAKTKEAERRKTQIKIEWKDLRQEYEKKEGKREEEIENFEERGYLKLENMGYRSRINHYEVIFGILPSLKNHINAVKYGGDYWRMERQETTNGQKFSRIKKFPALEEAQKFYEEQKKSIEEKIKQRGFEKQGYFVIVGKGAVK